MFGDLSNCTSMCTVLIFIILVLIFLYTLTEAKIQITGYPGTKNQAEFYACTQCLPWREAIQGCSKDGLGILSLWREGISYVKSVAVKTAGWKYEGFWISPFHYAGETEYRKLSDCEDNVPTEKTQEINGFNISLKQCVYVNTSSPNTDETNVFAGPCEKKLPYVCSGQLGHYKDDPNSIIINPGTKFTNNDDVGLSTAADLEDCIFNLFKGFVRYAIEYDNITRQCRSKDADRPEDLPVVYEIESTIENTTVVYKNSKPVEFRSTVKNVQPIDWPCLSEPTVTASVSEMTLLTSDITTSESEATSLTSHIATSVSETTSLTSDIHVATSVSETTSLTSDIHVATSVSETTSLTSDMHVATSVSDTTSLTSDIHVATSVSETTSLTSDIAVSESETTFVTLEIAASISEKTSPTSNIITSVSETTSAASDIATSVSETTLLTSDIATSVSETTSLTTSEISSSVSETTSLTSALATSVSEMTSLTSSEISSSVSETTVLISDVNDNSTSLSFIYSTSSNEVTNDTCCECHFSKIKEELGPLTVLDKSSLSRFKMQKISASDTRVSAATIGYFGAGILITVFCVIIFADIHSFIIKTNSK